MDHLSIEKHIASQFNDDLEGIRTRLFEMGGRVEEQLKNALKAIRDADSEIAATVIKNEELIDDMEIRIDEDCLLIIARRQPAASDLRLIISVGRAVTDLERVGDEAKKIAQLAVELTEQGPAPRGYSEVRHIGKSVQQMLHNSLDAFARYDVDAALETLREDDQIDRDYESAIRELMTFMMEDPRSIRRVMNIMWAIRSLERIGDHARNLCEHVVFVVKGKDIRHGNDEV